MPDPTPASATSKEPETPVTPAATVTPAAVTPEPAKPASPVSTTPPAAKSSIISDAGKDPTKVGADGKPVPAAVAETVEAKAAREATEADNKRIMEADEKTLTADELAKKADLVKAAEEAKNKTVPDKYDIKVPDGMTLDETVLAEFTPLAKELNLTNEGVQKLADFQAKFVAKQMTSAQQTQQKAFETYVDNITKESVEFFGTKLEAELPYVAKGRDNFADAEVMELLEATGLSNHKAFIKMFAKMGRTVSEDRLVEGRAAVQGDTRTDGQVIYAKDK